MPKVLDNIITGAAPDPAAHTVALTWANGATTVSSFHHLVGKGVFAAFADPAFFAHARVGEGGRVSNGRVNSTSARMRCGSRRTPKTRPSNRNGRAAKWTSTPPLDLRRAPADGVYDGLQLRVYPTTRLTLL